jgi:hypothetical protein
MGRVKVSKNFIDNPTVLERGDAYIFCVEKAFGRSFLPDFFVA